MEKNFAPQAKAVASVIIFLLVSILISSTAVNRTITPDSNNPPDVHLGDTIAMSVKTDNFFADKKYLLYLSDFAVTGIKPQVTSYEQKYTLSFQLVRNGDSENSWGNILHQLSSWEPKPVTVCVGPDDHSKAVTCVTDGMKFQAISKTRFAAWFAIATVIFLFFIRAITSDNSTVLRDWHPAGAPGARPDIPSFSLGRVQMAFWFVLVVLAFLFIWLTTGDTPALSTSTLALLGIGSGTALGGAVIDDSNNEPASTSEGFLKDLLTNADGYGFHRVQMLIWTVVLGVTFVTAVMATLSMPVFDNTLLVLMGISSGTYLGFKFTEQKTPVKSNS